MNDHSAPANRRPESPLSPAPATLRPMQNASICCPRVVRSRTFPTQASHTPGVPPPLTDAACIGHSMDGPDAQSHNLMYIIIFDLLIRHFLP